MLLAAFPELFVEFSHRNVTARAVTESALITAMFIGHWIIG
jgi:hypothetical protein